jgi:hypothetical protein
MVVRATSEDFPKARQIKVKPFHQVDVDSCSSSATCIEGYNYAAVFVDYCCGFLLDLQNDD